MHSAWIAVPCVGEDFALRAAAVLGEGFAGCGVAVAAALDGAVLQVGGDEPGAGVADAAVRRPGVTEFGGVGVSGAVSFEVPVFIAAEALDVFESHFQFRLSQFARYYGYC